MKTTIQNKQSPNDTFPSLWQDNGTGEVYLMISEVEGTCLLAENDPTMLGQYFETLDPNWLSPFNGSISLEN